MPAKTLDHCNVCTTKLDDTVRFYTDLLGLTTGYRPAGVPGAWLYDSSERPILHVIDIAPGNAIDLPKMSGRDPASYRGSGAIDHIAFEASDYDGLAALLTRKGVAFRTNSLPEIPLRQIFVMDPNDIQIELNFRA